jgi:hypothetical protein
VADSIASPADAVLPESSRRPLTWSVSRRRLVFAVFAAAYIAVFVATYIAFTYPAYAYMGFGYRADESIGDTLAFFGLAIWPVLWLPTEYSRPSSVFVHLQYFLIYIPALWMISNSTHPALGPENRTLLFAALSAGMGVLIWAHVRWPLISLPRFRIHAKWYWPAVYAIAAALTVVLVAQVGGNFHLVSLAEIYILRAQTSDLIEASGSHIATYAFYWLNEFLLPLIVARAIACSNRTMILVAAAAFVFLFGIWGSKATLFSPIILIATSYWSSRRVDRMPLLMVSGFMLLLSVPALIQYDSGIGKLIQSWWITIVNMRSFTIPGLLVAQYFDFFSNHALTFGSHITGVNLLVPYPYDYDVPRTVGYYYYGDLVTSNGNFWAQDGLAGFGLIGVVAMSFLAAAVLWLLDSVTRGLNVRFVMTALSGILLGFANVSLFTTLMTGGLGFFMAACLLMPRDRFMSQHRA